MFFAFTVLSMIFVGGFLLFCAVVVCFKDVENNFRRGGYQWGCQTCGTVFWAEAVMMREYQVPGIACPGCGSKPYEPAKNPFYGYGPEAMEQYFMDEVDDPDNPFLYDEV